MLIENSLLVVLVVMVVLAGLAVLIVLVVLVVIGGAIVEEIVDVVKTVLSEVGAGPAENLGDDYI